MKLPDRLAGSAPKRALIEAAGKMPQIIELGLRDGRRPLDRARGRTPRARRGSQIGLRRFELGRMELRGCITIVPCASRDCELGVREIRLPRSARQPPPNDAVRMPKDDTVLTANDNVIAFRSRAQAPVPAEPEHSMSVIDMECYPVDIRGHVTFGRLVSGLAHVGLTVRIDVRSGRVVITDEMWEHG